MALSSAEIRPSLPRYLVKRGNTQRDSRHGNHGDERDEMVLALGAGVAQADEQREGLQGDLCEGLEVGE